MSNVIEIAKKAKEASIFALQMSTKIKNDALHKIADAINLNKNEIILANNFDLNNAKLLLEKGEITQSAYNRLKLDENKLRDMIQGVRDIAALDDPINKVIWEKDIAQGINLKKVSCPIGVIGVIFEARPDVISQISALAIKSSNAVILKGGSEAEKTNAAIFKIITSTISEIDDFPENMINLIFSREDVKIMLDADKYIDLIIPRGSNSLVSFIKSNTKIPVLGHADGICHIYIDDFADISKVVPIIIDAKCQYPSACNSVETVLINRKVKDKILPFLIKSLRENSVVINSDEELKQEYSEDINAIVSDWHKEYGEKILSLKIVENIEEAISHINKFGSGHTDCIITENDLNAEKFMMFVDSAGVYKNISTRFADGFRYGFGAEVGISTNKTHARGPVGLEGLTIYKYKLFGNGDIVNDFTTGIKQFYK
ncbi:TPA: glutamate-5-semialdehyde dehydrogenase [Candidatus Avigastranaerophilus faecigallinarum]|nr:glutamate-5-semialdehyde dehydrogenase [Candidatus Avigastranaerophilus faecigallinarum]